MPTIIAGLVVALLVGGAVWKLIRDRSAGRGGCSCGGDCGCCDHCAHKQ